MIKASFEFILVFLIIGLPMWTAKIVFNVSDYLGAVLLSILWGFLVVNSWDATKKNKKSKE